jgi:hypothetical protein
VREVLAKLRESHPGKYFAHSALVHIKLSRNAALDFAFVAKLPDALGVLDCEVPTRSSTPVGAFAT